MDDPRMHAPQVEDPLTGLPWSEAVSEEIAAWASEHAVHAICVYLIGLGKLAAMLEHQGSPSVMSTVAQRFSPLMGPHDRFTRYSGNKFMIFSTRPRDEIGALVEAIREEVSAVTVEIDGLRVPQCRIGVATVADTEEHRNAYEIMDALMTAAEKASAAPGTATEQAPPAPLRAAEPKAAEPAKGRLFLHRIVPAAPPARPREASKISTSEPESPVPAQTNGRGAAAEVDHPEEELSQHRTPGPVPAQASHKKESAAIMNPQPSHVEPQVRRTGSEAAPDAAFGIAAQPWDESDTRMMLKEASLDITGMTATATVELMLGRRSALSKAVDRNTPDRRLALVGEAAARAITDLLPKGFGVALRDVQFLSTDFGKILVAVAQYISPMGDEFLYGVASVNEESAAEVAKSLLSAVNRRVGPMLVKS